jgi:hypothetical protein
MVDPSQRQFAVGRKRNLRHAEGLVSMRWQRPPAWVDSVTFLFIFPVSDTLVDIYVRFPFCYSQFSKSDSAFRQSVVQ